MIMTEKAEELRDEINDKETSQKNKELFENINEKLQDKSFIEMAVQTAKSNTVTHTPVYEEEHFDHDSHD